MPRQIFSEHSKQGLYYCKNRQFLTYRLFLSLILKPFDDFLSCLIPDSSASFKNEILPYNMDDAAQNTRGATSARLAVQTK